MAVLMREYQPVGLGIHGRRVGEDYEFLLMDPPILISITNLYEARGDIRAEMQVRLNRSEEFTDLLRERITITGGTSKAGFANRLEAKPQLDETVAPFKEIVETICNAAIDSFRAGEPFLTLAKLTPPASSGFLVDRLLPYQQATVLYGDGESGKSITALFVAIAVATGKALPHILPMREPGPVLYLDWETTWENQLARLGKMCQGLGIPIPPNIRYRRMTRSLPDELRPVKQEIDRLGAVLVICDSMGMACGGEPEKADTAIRFFTTLRGLGNVTSQVIHHVSWAEAEKEGVPRSYGSIFIRNQARSMWAVRRAGVVGKAYADVGFWHTKANDNVHFRSFGLHYEFGEEAITMSSVNIDSVPSLAVHAPLGDRIREVLGSEPLSPKDIAEELGYAEGTIKNILVKMDGIVNLETKGGRGKPGRWVLKSDRIEQEEIDF